MTALIIPYITPSRSGGVAVHYAVVFETDDMRSTDESGMREVLKSMVAKALSEATSLPIDMLSFTFEPGTQNQYDGSMRTTNV